MADIHIGISGWRYAPWRKDFYPVGLVQKDELRFASRAVGSIEINGSFYALQTPERFAQWYGEAPKGFVFSVKGPRYITHTRRLREIETPLANFFASGVLQLRDKLGPLLWQFPPNFTFDPERFEHFLSVLPRTMAAAKRCAEGCDARLRKAGYNQGLPRGTLRHAVEIRHDSFAVPAFVALLRKYKVALVVADTAGKWPYLEDLTADFVYIRLHGDAELYKSGYSAQALAHWRARIERWAAGGQVADAQTVVSGGPRPRARRAVYCYFDNDVKVRAPYDARALIDLLHLGDALEARPGQPLE